MPQSQSQDLQPSYFPVILVRCRILKKNVYLMPDCLPIISSFYHHVKFLYDGHINVSRLIWSSDMPRSVIFF